MSAGKRTRRPIKAADMPPTPMEQLMAAAECVAMRGLDSEADANPLLRHKTPQEAIKECQELARWLYHTAFYSKGEDHGARAVYLMLSRALSSIDRQLDGLFEGARRVVEEAQNR